MDLFKNNLKRMKGQMASILNLAIAFFVVVAVGLFAFELTRYLLARDELKTNVEVAALSCQTTLASSGDPTSAANQQTAENTALQLFKQNSILGQPMSSAMIPTGGPSALDPAPGQAQIVFQFLDPLTRVPVNASGAGVDSGVTDPAAAGTLVQAVGSYCYSPSCGQFIGLANAQFTFQVSALAGIPKIDLMVLLDISGGMDDDTSVSFYQRYEGPTGTNWMIPSSTGSIAVGSPSTVWCGGRPPNILPPCELEINGTCLQYSQNPTVPASNGLAATGIGSPPPPWCGIPLGMIPTETKHIAMVYSPNKHLRKLKIARTKTHKNTNSLIGLNKNDKKLNISIRTSDPGLMDICQKISGKHATSNLVNKTVISQLDDKFSQVSFKPNFDVLWSGSLNNNTTAGSTTTGCNNTINDPANNPVLPTTYTGSDGMTYVPISAMPGSLANTDPNPPMPTISANGCVGNISTITGFGPAAPNVFTGIVANGVVGDYNPNNPAIGFNNIATAIEASLGDLESPTLAAQAGIDTNALGVTPQAGWYAFYYIAARQYLQPMMAILNGLIGFINEMSITADIYYGFIAFNDNIGVAPNSVSAPINNVSSLYNFTTPNPTGGLSVNSTYPLPNIPLNPPGLNPSNQAAIINVLPTLSVWGNRNVTQALTAALGQLQSNGRPGANPVILLITCGAPSGADDSTAAIAEATTIGQAGIPVYVMCASLNSSYDDANYAAYTEIGGASGGVAGASGHGAKYFAVDFVDPTTTGNQLVTIYGNIARRLVSIVQSN